MNRWCFSCLRVFVVAFAFVMSRLAIVSSADSPIHFTDVTQQAGITFVHNSGAFGKKYLPETLGSGGVVLDVDEDGWQDLLLINSMNWPGRAGARSYPALYRNNRNGTFTDIARGSGLDVEMYGIGGAAADFDNDGHTDVYVTALGGNRLFKGLGGGKFVDVTKKAGVADSGFSTSALWFDYDNDGKLDLFVTHYVEWSIEKDLFCTLDGKNKSYCTPESYKGQSPTLFHNRGDGTFEDVTRRAGLYDTDVEGARRRDARLRRRRLDGSVRRQRHAAEPAVPQQGQRHVRRRRRRRRASRSARRAWRAPAWASTPPTTTDPAARASIIGNFSNEMMALYHNEGNGLFIDEAPTSAIGRASLLTLTFGCFFFDYDLDGRPDIFAANGHVADDIERVQSRVTYAQRPHLFHNLGQRRFEEVTPTAGAALAPMVARGAAYGGLRQRRRSRRAGDREQRAGAAVPQRRRQPQQRAARGDGRDHVESRRHRGARRGLRPRRAALADREDRIELRLAERAAAHLRPRECHGGRRR